MKRSNLLLLMAIVVVTLFIAPFLGAEILFLKTLSLTDTDHKILWELRYPRMALAFFVGGSLGVLGAVYQNLFHNPLSEPYVLGVSSGATLAIVAAEAFLGIGTTTLIGGGCGFVGGLIVTLLLLLFAQRRSEDRLLLFGIGINFFLSSLLFIILSFQLQSSQSNFRFLFGQMPWTNWKEVGLLTGFLIPLLSILWMLGRKMDALSLGDSVARTLGTHPPLIRSLILSVSSLILCSLVLFTGSIGFVGLAVPHVARLSVAPQSMRQTIVTSFVIGGWFLIVADVISRALFPPYEFPIGTITTLIGGPIFIWVLCKR